MRPAKKLSLFLSALAMGVLIIVLFFNRGRIAPEAAPTIITMTAAAVVDGNQHKHTTEQAAPPIIKLAEFTRYQTALQNKATAYVCLQQNCKLPTTDVKQMLSLLGAKQNAVRP